MRRPRRRARDYRTKTSLQSVLEQLASALQLKRVSTELQETKRPQGCHVSTVGILAPRCGPRAVPVDLKLLLQRLQAFRTPLLFKDASELQES